MNLNDIYQYVHENSKQLLDSYLEPDKSKKGYICPSCNNGVTGGTGDGLREDPNNPGRYKCFRCGFYGDIFDLIGVKEGIFDNLEKIKYGCELFNLSLNELEYQKSETSPEVSISLSRLKALKNENNLYLKDIAKSQEALKNDSEALNYLNSRGISKKTAIDAGVGIIFSFTGIKKGLLFPSSNAGFNVRNLDQNCSKKDRFRKSSGGVDLPFNILNIETVGSDPVYITEGELDALSILEAGVDAIALNGQGRDNLLFSLQALKIKRPLILALDQDKSGLKSQKELKKFLETNDYKVYESRIISDNCKDPNESLCKNKEYFLNTLKNEIRLFKVQDDLYDRTSINSLLKNVNYNIQNNLTSTGIKTGFHLLEDKEYLDGGLYEGLYLLGAVSSIGKTTFVHQMADQIAQNGRRVVFLSLEVSPEKLIAKSLSRQSYLTQNSPLNEPLSMMDIIHTNENRSKIKGILELSREYENLIGDRINFLDSQILEEISLEDYLNDYFKKYKEAPVLIIDYLQLLHLEDKGYLSEKQIIDHNINYLIKLSHKFKIPIIVISSFNRESYRDPNNSINLASYYGSSSIEYSADVLMTLENSDKKHPDSNFRYVNLKILKNRNGASGKNILFEYSPKFNFFRENQNQLAEEKTNDALTMKNVILRRKK